ncbi:JmjC domain-containing protein-like protein [Hapsidospora chrysogenum ATCC 11550]|uniref:JmjC domain-containing protein-like protein n=1 Tax=Hapsidospora chrysogenum (strain ATCC 11550 / CBS 779.69 / DSM 880 / IAM 14645 / JCM 23072 / IMI 49137) TaxID=857340 RepID=A0A086TAB1_HAPC1|nr:JmjC domain-containing protein-like protein [Hapsidospora chrysogenum ATCC 11550]
MAASRASTGTQSALRELIATFNDLNTPAVEDFDEEPSPLEFMRFAARNTPFVVRGGASSWPSAHKWSPEYLKSALHGQTVNVAVTPHGNADAPTFSPAHNGPVISKPCEEEQPFGEFLDYVIRQETDPAFPPDAEVRYAQTQNDNFRNEYMSLFSDAQKDIPFARIALEKDPDAINLWIGNSRSVTALHRDPMENIYVQVIGKKHFVLLPPLFHACVNEKLLLPATYARSGRGLDLRVDQDAEPVPLATWDPDVPEVNATEFSSLVKPLRVTLNPGDMLYLPAMWYHKVKQSSNEEGCVVAINYWSVLEGLLSLSE